MIVQLNDVKKHRRARHLQFLKWLHDDDLKAAKKMRLPWWGVLCVIFGTIPVCFLFDHFGRFDLARPTVLTLGILGFALAVKWRLRRRVWFWSAMTVFVLLHVLLILSVTWTTKWVPAAVSAGIGSIDLYVMLTILSVVEKFTEGPTTSEI
jgi:hypothetical protein